MARLSLALRLLVDLEPILGSRLVRGIWSARWERLTPACLDALTIEVSGEEDSFYGIRRDPCAGPQLAARLVGRRLILKVSHLAADAGAVRALGYRLAALYQGHDDRRVSLGDRGSARLKGLLHPRHWGPHLFTAARELRALGWPLRGAGLLEGMVGDEHFQLRTLHLSADRVEGLRAFAKARGATLNDLVAAGLLRALARLQGSHRPLRLLNTVDLRRYLTDERALPTCNLSAFMGIVPGELGPELAATVLRTREWTGTLKGGRPGAWYLLTWGPLLRLLPFSLGVACMREYLRHSIESGRTPPVFTNMGLLDAARLDFGEPGLRAAWMVLPLFRPPATGCGLSGFKGSLTLTQGFSGGPAVAARVEAWHRAFDQELDLLVV